MNAAAGSASRFRKISEIARMINAGSDLNARLERIVYAVCRHSEWASCAMMRIDAKAGYSVLVRRFDSRAPDTKTPADRGGFRLPAIRRKNNRFFDRQSPMKRRPY
ncbi:MAG: hypothetical protein OXU96_10910 [Gammaproteobacteria bacterium]|nr:hypothetical protein [Gammaproteobacteria bacterium]